MPLDPDATELLASIRRRTATLVSLQDLAGLRAAAAEVGSWNERVAITRVESFEIVADSRPLRLRFYAQVEGPAPTLIFFHGGGFVMGSIETHDALVRQLVLRSGWSALSVDYRLAPEHRYPAALRDGYAALEWAVGPAGNRMGVDARNLAVCGESAGANIAAALALCARDRGGPQIAQQILLYPVLDPRCQTDSHRDPELQCQLTSSRVQWYLEQYIGPNGDRSDPLAAPGLCADLSRLPKTTLVTAEYDPLRDEAEDYARRLIDAGVDVRYRRFNGTYHGFMNQLVLRRAQESLDYVTEGLRYFAALS
jgi:acetyl esterase